jgi:hypothetical protein
LRSHEGVRLIRKVSGRATIVSKVARILIVAMPFSSLYPSGVESLFGDRTTFRQLDVAYETPKTREANTTTRTL